MNLTGAKTWNEAMDHHVVDALALVPIFDLLTTRIADDQDLDVDGTRRTAKLIDVGSGAGFPGLILAIAFPEWEITLLDSLRKRTEFLKAAAEHAEIENVKVVWGRAEVTSLRLCRNMCVYREREWGRKSSFRGPRCVANASLDLLVCVCVCVL